MTKRRALFLDRDGVINVDHAYVIKREEFEFIDGIFELCREAKRLDYLLVVVTNQAGIGRGYYSEGDFIRLTEWMREVFFHQGCQIDAVYFSPFHPEYGIGKYKKDSECRKPNPGMILQAVQDFNVDLGRSVLIGDKLTDIDAGLAAGVGSNLLFMPSAGNQNHANASGASAIVATLLDAIQHL